MIILQLFLTFALIGAFSFGGGYAMLPLIQREVVENHHWFTLQEFSDILAISEMTPGPIAINSATFVGYKIAGIFGSIAATIGVVLPSFIIILVIAKIVIKNKDNPYFQGAFSGLRPIVVAMITSAAIMLAQDIIFEPKTLVLTLIALAITLFTKMHPILLILIFGLLGIFI